MIRPNAKEFGKMLKPFADRHISASEKESFSAGQDREQVAKDWNGMMSEWQDLMQAGDFTAPAAQELARRWIAFTRQFPIGDALKIKEKIIMEEAMSDPATAEKLALYRDIGAFAEKAVAHWKALEK
jgi:hypothetical protein